MNLSRNHSYIQTTGNTARLINEFLPKNQRTILRYECLPSFSTMQFAEIVDINDAVVVQQFGIESGKVHTEMLDDITFEFDHSKGCHMQYNDWLKKEFILYVESTVSATN